MNIFSVIIELCASTTTIISAVHRRRSGQSASRRYPANMLLEFGLILHVVFAVCDASSRQKRIVGGYPALVPEANAFNPSGPPRKTDNVVFVQDDYYRTATITGTEEAAGYGAYKGIRYAEPPVGRFRFQVR